MLLEQIDRKDAELGYFRSKVPVNLGLREEKAKINLQKKIDKGYIKLSDLS